MRITYILIKWRNRTTYSYFETLNFRYEAIVPGDPELIVMYRDRLYYFEVEHKLQKFLRLKEFQKKIIKLNTCINITFMNDCCQLIVNSSFTFYQVAREVLGSEVATQVTALEVTYACDGVAYVGLYGTNCFHRHYQSFNCRGKIQTKISVHFPI